MTTNESHQTVRFDRGERSLLFGATSLAVARGSGPAIARVQQYLDSGLDAPANDHQTIQRVLSRFRANREHVLSNKVMPAVTRLNVGNTYHCNMGCTYCYNELPTKDRKGSEVSAGMSLGTATAMVDALVAQSNDEQRLSLVFIGGEALLERKVLFATIAYAREQCHSRGKSLDVGIYTNGTLMEKAVVDWCNEHEVDLVISLDGPPAINDKYRVFLNGRPTSATVLRNVRYFMEHTQRRWRRVNAVAGERRNVLPIAKYLLDLGFNDIHIQTAYGLDGFGDRGNAGDLLELLAWYRELLLAGTVIALSPFIGILLRLVAEKQDITSWMPCTTGYSSLGVGPDGTIYPCHHFLEEGSHKLGHVTGGLPDRDARAHLVHAVTERTPCATCWARHACGGECYHRAHTAGRGYAGTVEEACDGRRALIGLTLDLFADLAASRPDVLVRLAAHDYSLVPFNDAAYQATDLSAYGAVESSAEKPRVMLPVLNISR